MADFLDEKRSEMGSRLKELEPLVHEYERLREAVAALDGVAVPTRVTNGSGGARRARTTPKKSAAGRPGTTGKARRGRPKGSGARGAQALAIVKDNPGIAIPQIAQKMGIKQNYLYRVLPGLAEAGLLIKDGRGWHATDTASAAA